MRVERFLLLLAGLAAMPPFPAASSEGESRFELAERKEGRRIVFSGVNRHPNVPWHAVIDFRKLVNYRASVPLPARVVVPPGGRRDLFVLEPSAEYGRFGYEVKMISGPGDPAARPDPAHLYLLPFEHGTKRLVGQGYLGKFTHRGDYALDFNMDEGTRVCAARDGVVFKVKEDSTQGGTGADYNDKANHIHVLHADGTWGEYAHLKVGGALVEEGEPVRAGQVIGLSGNTGRSAGPHLHFTVRRATWGGSETLPTAFLGRDGAPVSIEDGKWYYAYHPGGGEFDAVVGADLVEADLERHRRKIDPDGEITFRAESIDNRVLVYCRNGTERRQSVRIGFRRIAGFTPSKPVPRTVEVPAGFEVYVLMLTRKRGAVRAEYELKASAKPVDSRR